MPENIITSRSNGMIIVGLGNPGSEYSTTRHNLGWQVIDALAVKLGLTWTKERDVMAARLDPHWLVKPQMFVNRSGESLRDWLDYKNISTDPADLHRDLIVVHDELDFEPGVCKLQRDRSSAGHNGVQSIIDQLNSKDFFRLRIGIGSGRELGIPNEDFVLQRPPATEREALAAAVIKAVDQLQELIEKGGK